MCCVYCPRYILDHIIQSRASSLESSSSRKDYDKYSYHDGLLFQKNSQLSHSRLEPLRDTT
jgi:hypothetical protein